MATDFICGRVSMRLVATNVTAVLASLLWLADCALATEVSVIALFPDKATLVVDRGKPRTVRAGDTFAGVTLVSASSEEAVVLINGKQRKLRIGEGVYAAQSPESSRASVTLVSDNSGHVITTGSINGATMRFLVDTGATLVSMSAEDARRAGINYLAGQRGQAQTANGIATVYKVKLDSVKVGDITLRDIDAIVHDGAALPVVLLGMSFLGRLDMRREGDTITLTRRY
jgi:aspartyl protease family protein